MRVIRWAVAIVLIAALVVTVAGWVQAGRALDREKGDRLAAELQARGLAVAWGTQSHTLMDSLRARDAEVARLHEEAGARPIASGVVRVTATDTLYLPLPPEHVTPDSAWTRYQSGPLSGRIAIYPWTHFGHDWLLDQTVRLDASETADGRLIVWAEADPPHPQVTIRTAEFYYDIPRIARPPRSIRWSCIGAAAGAGYLASREAWAPAGALSVAALWRCR